MRGKQICFCLALILGVASVTYAADYLISSWESSDSNDGWTTCEGWGYFGNTVLTPAVTTGVTLGSRAIKVENDIGWYWGMKVYVDPVKFHAYDTFKLDITRLEGDWTLSGDPSDPNNLNRINFRVQCQGVSLQDVGNADSGWLPSDGNSPITASWDYSAFKSMFPATPSWLEFAIAFNSEYGYTGHDGRGIYYLDNARLTKSASQMTIAKCKIKAGKIVNGSQGDTDFFSVSGTIGDFDDLNDIDEIVVSLISGDGETIYSEEIDDTTPYLDIAGRRFKYSYKIPRGGEGAITSFKIDFNKNTFSISAKNVDLTGLACPVELEMELGGETISAVASETIVNGSRSRIQTRLMRLYQDTLVVTKAKAKASTSPLSDSLTVKGEIAVENIDDSNLVNGDVVITWGDLSDTVTQTFTIPAGSFVADKTGNVFKCSKVSSGSDDGLVTAKFDLSKCNFALTVKNADSLYIGTDEDAVFGINFTDFADFNETADVNMTTGRSF